MQRSPDLTDVKKLFFMRSFFFIMFLLIYVFHANTTMALIGIDEGDQAKEIELTSLRGDEIRLSTYLGHKPVILAFWKITTNKAFIDYSLDMLRFLNDYYEKYHDTQGLEIVAIYAPFEFENVSQQEVEEVRNIVDDNNIQYTVLIDRGFRFFKEYGVIALPSTVMIGRSGTIDFIYSSFPQASRQIIAEKIEELVGVEESAEKKQKHRKIVAATKSGRLYRYALQMFKRGLVEQALSALTKSLELNPDDSWAHNLMGIILWRKGLVEHSQREFMAAIRIDEGNAAPHINSAVLHIAEGKYSDAEKILITSPSAGIDMQIRAHQLLAMVYSNTDRTGRAIEELEKAVALSSDSFQGEHTVSQSSFTMEVSMLHDLAILYERKGDSIRAQKTLHEALHQAFGLDGSFTSQHLGQRNDLMLYE